MNRRTRVVVVRSVILFTALAFAVTACTAGNDAPTPTPPSEDATAAAGVRPTVAPTPAGPQGAVGASPVQPALVTIGQPVALPIELALILATGNGLDRVVRTADGDTIQEALFDPADHGGTQRITYWNIHHIGPVLPPGQFALAVCTAGDCGGHDQASADAAVSLFQSSDGGVTWEAGEPLDGAFLITTATRSDRLLLSRLAQAGRPSGKRYEWWPSGDVATPPANWAGPRGPYLLPDGMLLWWSVEGLVDSRGITVIDLGEQLTPSQAASGIAALPSADGERLAVTWKRSDVEAPSDDQWFWSIYERVGAGASVGVGYALTQTLETPVAMIPTAWIDGSRLLVNAEFEASTPGPGVRLPSILDLERAMLTPITGPFGERGIGDAWAVAVEIGPFARVVIGAGDCLDVRAEPSLESARLDCVVDGVLLRQGGLKEAGWLPVRTPTGDEGWASTEFLEYAPEAATGGLGSEQDVY